MKRSLTILPVLFLMVLACNKTDDPINLSKPELLFSSGFEAGTFITEPIDDYEIIRGKDDSTGFSWPLIFLVLILVKYIGFKMTVDLLLIII